MMDESDPKPDKPVLLCGASVWIDPPGRFTPVSVLVHAGEIVALPPPETDIAEPVRVVDLSGAYLVPGLINTHVHLEFSASRNPLNDYLAEPPAERMLRALGNAHRLLLSGVTTARDCGSHWELLTLARHPELATFPLPRLLFSGPPITVRRGHLHFMNGEADDVAEVCALLARLCDAGATSIKAIASGGGMTPGTFPERATYPVEILRFIAEDARRGGRPSAAHVLATESIRRAAAAGFDSLEHCAFFERTSEGTLVRCYDADTAQRVADSGAAMMANLSTATRGLERVEREGPHDAAHAHAMRQHDIMRENFGRMVRIGVQMVCGTDAGVRDTPFEETWREYAAMVRAGLPSVDALRAATTRAAAALHLQDRIGRIAPGFAADFVAVRRDPLRDADAFRSVDLVMQGGEIVYRRE